MQLPTAEQIEQAFAQVVMEGIPSTEVIEGLTANPALRRIVDIYAAHALKMLEGTCPELTSKRLRPILMAMLTGGLQLGLAINRPEPYRGYST